MVKISIITLTKNSERYLHETTHSITSQLGINSSFELEHVIVDAGSTDGTPNIVERYQRSVPYEVRIIHERKPQGITHALNLGISGSAGEIVNHLHSDDMYSHNSVLSKVAAAFDNNPDIRWLYSGYNVIDSGGRIIKKHERGRFYYLELFNRSIVPHPAAFIKRSAFEELGMFDTSYKCSMDYEFWFRLGKSYTPLVINDYFANFRTHSQSTSVVSIEAAKAENFAIKKKYLPVVLMHLNELSQTGALLKDRKAFADILYRMAQTMNRPEMNLKKEALHCLKQSLVLDPLCIKRYLYLPLILFSQNYRW
jgi:glycosyltransferase involved in cell wall biosynthesis